MNILEVLEKLEWSGQTKGTSIPCCPLCNKAKPNHDEECELKGLIKEFTVPNWALATATAPTNAPRWKASGGDEYMYTVSSDWLIVNEQYGSTRIRQICKILKEFRIGPNGVIAA